MYEKMSHELYYSACHMCNKSTYSKDDIHKKIVYTDGCYLLHVQGYIAYDLEGCQLFILATEIDRGRWY